MPAGLSNVIAIAAGGSNSVALKSDKTIVIWGDNSSGQTNIPGGVSNVVAISAGGAHIMALRNDGTLFVWGWNGNGQTNVPSSLASVSAISAGAFHSLATINVGPVTFLSQPISQSIYGTTDATFSTAVLGTPPLSYQWRRDGSEIAGATNASFTLTNTAATQSGNYQVVVSNSFGGVTSTVAVLTVNDPAPVFTIQPTNAGVLQKSNLTLSASVAGLPPLAYQWYFNGSGIGGATNLTFSRTNMQVSDGGNYSLSASNSFGGRDQFHLVRDSHRSRPSVERN